MAKITLKDSSTFCPLNGMPEGIVPGSKIKVKGEQFTVSTYVTPYQASIVEKSFHVLMKGCSKSTPQEVDFELLK